MGKTLVEHAAYELTKAGLVNHEDPEARKVATDVMALVRRFEKQDHSEKTAGAVLEFFETVCNFLPLTPLTNDPSEWEVYEDIERNLTTNEEKKTVRWASKRASSIFSMDEGKTWYDARTRKTGELLDHVEYAKQLAKDNADEKARKEAAATRAANPKPIGLVDPGVPAAEQSAAPEMIAPKTNEGELNESV